MAVRKIEQELDRMSALRDAPESEAVAGLSKALGDRVNVIVAKAAKIAGARKLATLVPNLLRAYDSLFSRERDPQCWAKNAIAQALVDLEYRESAPFVHGIHYVQMEPIWEGQADTATTLRAICALALPACVDLPRPDILRLLVDGLADKADPVRVDTVRALGQMEGGESVLLLRLKARIGDATPQVTGQIFDSLLQLEREAAVPFVADFLAVPDEATRTEAALSLGSSRFAAAVDVLIQCWEENKDPDLRLAVLRGMAISRQERALEHLLALIRDGRARDACAAIEALSVDKDSEEIRNQAALAAADREPEIQDALRKAFG